MASERITIRVESNIGEDGPLTVMDALDQFRDAFHLFVAAVAQEEGGNQIKWRLEHLSKNSPATLTAAAYSQDPALIIAPLMQRGKHRFSDDMAALRDGKVAPWIQERSASAKSLFRRNLNGIGRTAFDFEGELPRTVLVERSARASLESLERAERLLVAADKSHSEYGMLDAYVTEAKTWNGRPAVYVKDRLTGRVVPCVLSDSVAEMAGREHSWSDAWNGQRVRIRGRLFYNKAGEINRVLATNLKSIIPRPVDLKAIREIDILGDKSPTQHLDELWGYANN